MNEDPRRSGISCFEEMADNYEFSIPNYQRAYAWTDKQALQLVADLAEHAAGDSQYYLGHFILESGKERRRGSNRMPVEIVDGQQRLTTVAIFIAVCRHLLGESFERIPLQLSVVDYDRGRFDEMLLPENIPGLLDKDKVPESTASLERVTLVVRAIHQSFIEQDKKPALLSKDKVGLYLNVIRKAAVSVAVYASKAVAAQIFELHNTRGVALSETEKVKALLMKYVYINGGNDRVSGIQESFSEVFRLEERAAGVSFRGEMGLDDLMFHHLRAVDDGSKSGNYNQPQNVEGENGCLEYVRKRLAAFDGNPVEGIGYAEKLSKEFARSMDLVTREFIESDEREPLVGDVVLLDQRRSMIFLLRYFRALGDIMETDRMLLRRWEALLFLWNFHDLFYNMKSSHRDSFSTIFDHLIPAGLGSLSGLIRDFYRGNKNFAYWKYEKKCTKSGEIEVGLDAVFREFINRHDDQFRRRAYSWSHFHGRYRYWLYKYEVEMAAGNAGVVRKSLRKLFKENDVTLDHMIPRELEWKELSLNREMTNKVESWKECDRDQAERHWEELKGCLDGIGNLVILSRSTNASLKNISPFRRAAEYQRLGLDSVSYVELAEFKAVADWKDPKTDSWEGRIDARGRRLMSKMKDYFTCDSVWLA